MQEDSLSCKSEFQQKCYDENDELQFEIYQKSEI